MSIYDKSSLVLIPSGTKTGKIFSQKPVSGDGDFTFTRASAATRVNADGNIEKETQNLLLQSNSFTSGNWFNQNSTIASGQSGYDGSSDAWLLSTTNVAASECRVRQDSMPIVTGVQSLSVYAKAGTLNVAYLQIVEGSNNLYFLINLDNGTTNYIIGQGNAPISVASKDIGGGWYRLTGTWNSSSSTASVRVGITNSLTNPYLTSSGGENIYIQDAQLEQGLVARDVITTTTAAVYGGITDNTPRLDYTDSSCPALLLEPQRTNLAANSEYYNNSDWDLTNFNSTIVTNAATSPEGKLNASSIVANTSNVLHYSNEAVYTATSGVDYTFSLFAKSNGSDYIQIATSNGFLSSYQNYNLSTGTLASGDAVAKGYTADIEDYGNGWYRCILTATTNSTSARFLIIPILTDTTRNPVFAGDGTNGVYIYAVQRELGSYATSYIPTYGSSVSRVEDAMNVTSATDIIGQTEGTIFVEVDAVDFSTDQRIGIGDGTATNRIVIRVASGSVIQLSAVIGSTTQASISGSGSVGNTYKIAGVYKENDFALWINGVEVANDTSGTISGTFTRIANDNGFSTQKFANPIKQFLLFKTRLSNEELAALTTI